MCARGFFAFAAAEYSFTGGELVVRTPDLEMRIRAWPQPQALVREGSENWKVFRPEFRLLKPGDGAGSGTAAGEDDPDYGRRQAFAALRATVPPHIVGMVERFQSHQWNLIELLAGKPEALDLLAVNPALAYCLANCDQFRRWTGASPAAHAGFVTDRRQRDILSWLGFPASEALARIFRKILPEAITPSGARMLRHALRSEPRILKLLAHRPVINAGVLALVTNLKLLPAVSPLLLGEVGAEKEEAAHPQTADLILDVMSMLWDLGRPSAVPRFESIGAVRRYHDRLVGEHRQIMEELDRRRREAAAARPRKDRKKPAKRLEDFPPPPLPGTEDIVPLTSAAALREEGGEQQNCVGSYARRVRSGRIYVYKVLRPERATLAIARGARGSWKLADLKAARNHSVTAATKAAIEHWLALYSISA